MATATSAGGAAPLRGGLPDEIIIWEILVRLPSKSLLRCRSVCRDWRGAISSADFLLAHHRRQPSLPIVSGYEYGDSLYENVHVFDHQAVGAQLQPLVQLHDSTLEASCDGLLIISMCDTNETYFFICNPVTRQHAPLRPLSGFSVLGMYCHGLTGEHRLLLRTNLAYLPDDEIGCYVLGLGSDQPPRYIGGLDLAESGFLHTPALLRDSLHWCLLHYQSDQLQRQTENKLVVVFDTTFESFRRMRASVVPAKSYIFEMDDTLGIYNCSNDRAIVDIWVLQNYESEVWHHEYCVELSDAEIKGRFGRLDDSSVVCVVSVAGDIILLVSIGGSMFYVDVDSKLVDNFYHDDQILYSCELRLKQTLVSHNFFTTLEGYAVNVSPFV